LYARTWERPEEWIVRPDGPDGSNSPSREASAERAALQEQTLQAVLARRQLSFSEIGRIGAQVADALSRGHSQGDPHGAVSPDCVMLDREGRARLVAPSAPYPEVPYLAPEQVRGEPAEPASDVYSLGLVLLEAATGAQVYPGSTPAAAEARLYHQPMVPNDVPGPLARALLAMTETVPQARPSASRAAGMLAGVPTASAPSSSGPQPFSAPIESGPNWGRIAAIGLPVLLLVILLGVLLANSGDDSAKNAAGSGSSSATATATSTPTETAEPTTTEQTQEPTTTSGHSRRSSTKSKSGGPDIALPKFTDLPKITKPDLPDLPSSSSVGAKVQSAWKGFTDWLKGLF
jgi:serine/threonine protein kinase